MLPFSILQWKYVVLALFVGAIMVILLFFAFQSRYYGIKRIKDEEIHKFPDGITEGKKPIPVFLVIIYVLLALWGIAYIILVSINGLRI